MELCRPPCRISNEAPGSGRLPDEWATDTDRRQDEHAARIVGHVPNQTNPPAAREEEWRESSETTRWPDPHLLGSRACRADRDGWEGTMSDEDDEKTPSGRPLARWVRIEAAAEWLGLGVRFLRRLVAEKRIPYSKVGKYLLFDLNELDAWVRSQHVDPLI